MGIARVHQSNFNRGEIDPKLIGRVSLASFGNSLKKARNVIVTNQGAVERRPGTYFRADLGAESRLESFIFSGDQEYIFAFPVLQLDQQKKKAHQLKQLLDYLSSILQEKLFYFHRQITRPPLIHEDELD